MTSASSYITVASCVTLLQGIILQGKKRKECSAYPDRLEVLSSTSLPSLALNTLAPLLASSCATSPWSPRTASYPQQHSLTS